MRSKSSVRPATPLQHRRSWELCKTTWRMPQCSRGLEWDLTNRKTTTLPCPSGSWLPMSKGLQSSDSGVRFLELKRITMSQRGLLRYPPQRSKAPLPRSRSSQELPSTTSSLAERAPTHQRIGCPQVVPRRGFACRLRGPATSSLPARSSTSSQAILAALSTPCRGFRARRGSTCVHRLPASPPLVLWQWQASTRPTTTKMRRRTPSESWKVLWRAFLRPKAWRRWMDGSTQPLLCFPRASAAGPTWTT
mmetsp:Transcript_9918/g.21808  ORF Transcript_9918/g.21808 Transcript_9918/m.21808 type:complete len:249 (-) Transcript_9918:568-1314(-)